MNAPPGQPGYKSDLLKLCRFVLREPRGFTAGMLFTKLRNTYPEEYRELVAERDVHPQTRRGARLALARNLISQESALLSSLERSPSSAPRSSARTEPRTACRTYLRPPRVVSRIPAYVAAAAPPGRTFPSWPLWEACRSRKAPAPH